MAGLHKAVLKIHIASGINIPIRKGSIQQIISLNNKISAEYGQKS
jgi:hypothetical protein